MESINNLNLQNQNKKESAVKSSFFFLFVIFVDQLSKHYANNIFYNNNFAFSLPLPIWLIYGIYFFVLTGMIFYVLGNYDKLGKLSKIAWILIFAGAVSNIAERIFTGHVRDFIFISFMKWVGVYNLADFFIIIGIIVLAIPASLFNHYPNDIKSF